MTPAENPQHPAQGFIQLWAQSLALVLGQIAGSPFSLLLSEVSPDRPAETSTDLFISVTASGPVQGDMGFRLPAAHAATLAKVFMQDEGAPDGLTDEGRAALEELFRQVAGYVATSSKPTLPDLALAIGLTPAFPWPPTAIGWIASAEGAPKNAAIEWRLSAGLEAAIIKALQDQNIIGNAAPATTMQSESNPERLGFFLDLELEVTLRFGAKQMLLKDLLELGPGSVIELDRDVQDPADLLLDGKLIARGEVVVVNGNYGLRVSEVFGAPQLAA